MNFVYFVWIISINTTNDTTKKSAQLKEASENCF